MKYLAIIIGAIAPLCSAPDMSLDFSGSAWITASEDFRNEYESLKKFNKVGVLRGSFSMERVSARVSFVHNEKYEKDDYTPYGVITAKVYEKGSFTFLVEGGHSNEHSIVNGGTPTPRSLTASTPTLSYNDMGWDREMVSSFVEPQIKWLRPNGDQVQLGVLKGRAKFRNSFTETGNIVGARLKYSRGLSEVLYGYFKFDQKFCTFSLVNTPIDIGGGVTVNMEIPVPKLVNVVTNFHAVSFNTYLGGTHKICGELMYVDSMKIYAADLRWIFPYSSKWSGLIAYHYNTIDIDINKDYNHELKKGVTFAATDHFSVSADLSYFHGTATFLTNGQAILPGQKELLSKNWGIASLTLQWDF